MSATEDRALLELNLQRETWCRVEADPRGSWERSQRRHYRSHLRSSPALLGALSGQEQRRASRRPTPPPVRLPERRHFEESYESNLA